MEDASSAMGSVSEGQGAWADTSFFGVFDGHGGAQVANFCEEHLPKTIVRGQPSQAPQALHDAFVSVDQMLADVSKRLPPTDPGHPNKVGTTAVACLISRDAINVANVGDSRAVLSRNGRAHDLSQDHKPDSRNEAERIMKAGGRVTEEHCGSRTIARVNGDLACSRAIGDLRFKNNPRANAAEQSVTCVPEITTCTRQRADQFLILACDGVWDVLSSQDVVSRVGMDLAAIRRGELQPSDVVNKIFDECLARDPSQSFGVGCDNMTMILVVFDDVDALNLSSTGACRYVPESPVSPATPSKLSSRAPSSPASTQKLVFSPSLSMWESMWESLIGA